MISLTAAPEPIREDYLLLQKIADAYGRLEELTPMSILMREAASIPVYKRPLSLYLFAGEPRPQPKLDKFWQ